METMRDCENPEGNTPGGGWWQPTTVERFDNVGAERENARFLPYLVYIEMIRSDPMPKYAW